MTSIRRATGSGTPSGSTAERRGTRQHGAPALRKVARGGHGPLRVAKGERTAVARTDEVRRIRTASHPSSSTSSSKETLRLPVSHADAACMQCHTNSTVFYCAICLSERIISHHINVRRVDEMRQKGERNVQALFFDGRSAAEESATTTPLRQALSDPFEDAIAKRSQSLLPLDQRRTLRARAVQLRAKTEAAILQREALVVKTDEARRQARDRWQQLDARRAMLQRAQQLTLHADQQPSDPTGDRTASFLSTKGMVMVQSDIKRLRSEHKRLAKKLAETRAILAREAFLLFCVTPPAGTMASVRATQTATTMRNRERYVPGAFVFDRKSRSDQPYGAHAKDVKREASPPVNPNDWAIMGLVLPLACDVKRFDRHRINGAIAHCIHLLHMLTTYLGVALPFAVADSNGSPTIRPNPLWGSGAKQSLYLSTATYQVLAQADQTGHAAMGIGSMGASMISNLGASTMSTLESFVQLPSGKHLPWAKNQIETPTAPNTIHREHKGGTASSSDERTSSASKQFCMSLTMLAYNVGYLAHLEGMQIDILLAAGSLLRLMSKMMSSPSLGVRAHMTAYREGHVDDLRFAQLDFAQLAQVQEASSVQATSRMAIQHAIAARPGKVAHELPPAKASRSPAQDPTLMETSYVDAKAAAQSILSLPQDGGAATKGTTMEGGGRIVSTGPGPSSLATERLPGRSAQRPVAKLDFLQPAHGTSRISRGPRQGSLPSSTPSKHAPNPTMHKEKAVKDAVQLDNTRRFDSTTAGTVLFNGKEVRARSGKASQRGKSDPAGRLTDPPPGEVDEEGWSVL